MQNMNILFSKNASDFMFRYSSMSRINMLVILLPLATFQQINTVKLFFMAGSVDILLSGIPPERAF